MGHQPLPLEHDQRFFGRATPAFEIAGPEKPVEGLSLDRRRCQALHALACGQDHPMLVDHQHRGFERPQRRAEVMRPFQAPAQPRHDAGNRERFAGLVAKTGRLGHGRQPGRLAPIGDMSEDQAAGNGQSSEAPRRREPARPRPQGQEQPAGRRAIERPEPGRGRHEAQAPVRWTRINSKGGVVRHGRTLSG